MERVSITADTCLDPAGSRIYVAHTATNAIDVIDRPANCPRIAKRLPLRGSPDVVMYDDTRRRLYVAVGSPGVASVFDTDRLEEVETIQTEEGAHTLGLDPATAQLYVFAPRRGGALVFEDAAVSHAIGSARVFLRPDHSLRRPWHGRQRGRGNALPAAREVRRSGRERVGLATGCGGRALDPGVARCREHSGAQ